MPLRQSGKLLQIAIGLAQIQKENLKRKKRAAQWAALVLKLKSEIRLQNLNLHHPLMGFRLLV